MTIGILDVEGERTQATSTARVSDGIIRGTPLNLSSTLRRLFSGKVAGFTDPTS